VFLSPLASVSHSRLSADEVPDPSPHITRPRRLEVTGARLRVESEEVAAAVLSASFATTVKIDSRFHIEVAPGVVCGGLCLAVLGGVRDDWRGGHSSSPVWSSCCSRGALSDRESARGGGLRTAEERGEAEKKVSGW
jgi:hypothetical protein